MTTKRTLFKIHAKTKFNGLEFHHLAFMKLALHKDKKTFMTTTEKLVNVLFLHDGTTETLESWGIEPLQSLEQLA